MIWQGKQFLFSSNRIADDFFKNHNRNWILKSLKISKRLLGGTFTVAIKFQMCSGLKPALNKLFN